MDSLSKEYQVKISRVTSQSRNPQNKASKTELSLINTMKLANIHDSLFVSGEKKTYYKSIFIGMPACLKCHGNESEIGQQTFETIKKLYPKDAAINYELGDFRGVWKVEF